jgi:hypothetical protein
VSETAARETAARERVAIVGAGLMGAQIGCDYALGGCTVVWVVRDRERAAARIEQALALALRQGLADRPAIDAARSRMSYSDPHESGHARDGHESDEHAGADRPPGLIVESLPSSDSTCLDCRAHTEPAGPAPRGLRRPSAAGIRVPTPSEPGRRAPDRCGDDPRGS